MSQQTNIASAFLRVASAINSIAARAGSLTNLNTTDKTNLVAALNEVLALIPDVTTVISDTTTAANKTWSSNKIQTQINAALTSILGGADGSSDSLKELADEITALAQADNGLLSFKKGQNLTTAEKLQGCSNLGVGDPEHNFVTAIEAALSTGL